MLYRANLSIEDPELIKYLDALVAKHQLTPFVKLAVESYIESAEGKKIFKSLAGNSTGVRKSRKKPTTVGSHAGTAAVEVKPVAAESSQDVRPEKSKEAHAEVPVAASLLISTDSIMSRILKTGGNV